MQSRHRRKSLCEKISYFFSGLMGYSSAPPQLQYAATFPFNAETKNTSPDQVNFKWLTTLSPGAMTGVIFNSVTTFTVSGTFNARFTYLAGAKIHEEFLLFRQGKNTKRFITETSMAFLAALAGAMIFGAPFSQVILMWVGRLLGFVAVGSLSFLGMCELIINLTDENAAFKLIVLDQLKRLHIAYHAQVNSFLDGVELNKETLPIFLKKVYDLAREVELKQAEQPDTFPVFREKTSYEQRSEYWRSKADYIISFTLAGICSPMYIESGFGGTNILVNNNFDSLASFAKILIGIPPALPLTLFIFFTIKVLQSPLVEKFPEIKKDATQLAKALLLAVFSVGNATWYHGLARAIASSENNFSVILNSDFGQYGFPLGAYLTSLIAGINGITPLVFPPQINQQQPQVNDVIKMLQHNLVPAEVVEGLRNHSFYTKKPAQAQVELAEAKQQEGFQFA